MKHALLFLVWFSLVLAAKATRAAEAPAAPGRDAPAAHSVIGGGQSNAIGTNSVAATISGGWANTIALNTPYAVISGGWANAIQSNAFYAVISGGFRNIIQADAFSSSVGGGRDNMIEASATSAVIAGGEENRILERSFKSTVSGGNANVIHPGSSYAAIGGGRLNNVSASYSTVAGGNGNVTEPAAFYATVPGGLRARAANFGQFAYASGRFSENGDAQTSMFVLRQQTYDDTETELFLDGMARRIAVPANAAWSFDILIIARTEGGVSCGRRVLGVIENDAGSTRLLGEPKVESLGGEADWRVSVQADDASDALVIKVAGEREIKTRWVANVRTVEVVY